MRDIVRARDALERQGNSKGNNMGKALIRITCSRCSKEAMKRKDNVIATNRRGGSLYCSTACATEAAPVSERLGRRSALNVMTGCVEWSGYTRGDGYGSLRVNKKQVQAHRVAYELRHGPIASGLLVCHKCDNRRCINPEHLFLGTNQDNVNDMMAKGRHRHQKPAQN